MPNVLVSVVAEGITILHRAVLAKPTEAQATKANRTVDWAIATVIAADLVVAAARQIATLQLATMEGGKTTLAAVAAEPVLATVVVVLVAPTAIGAVFHSAI